MKNIIQPWALTKASYNLSICEDRIFRQVISKMQGLMTFESINCITTEDFEVDIPLRDFLSHENSTNHAAVANALKKLRETTITFFKEDTGEFVFTGIIMEALYSPNRQNVCIRISKHLMPYLIFLKGFTRYKLEVTKTLRSPYTVRIYEWLCHLVNGKIPIFKTRLLVESLKLRLQISKKYKRAIYVKNFILKPAIEELKKKADVWFEIINPIKEGRKVVGWDIRICKREVRDKEGKKMTAIDDRLILSEPEKFASKKVEPPPQI